MNFEELEFKRDRSFDSFMSARSREVKFKSNLSDRILGKFIIRARPNSFSR